MKPGFLVRCRCSIRSSEVSQGAQQEKFVDGLHHVEDAIVRFTERVLLKTFD